MNTQTSRTTIDIDANLARQLKSFAAKQAMTQKQVISKAITRFINTESKRIDTQLAWKQTRAIADSGQEINLVQALRDDRLR